jgi:hypothetical protein
MNEYRLYQFKTKIKTGSLNDKLLNFLKAEGELSERERILQALLAYWLPLALLDTGDFTDKDIALCGLATIQKLKQQINHISLILSMQLPSYSHLFAVNLMSESLVSRANSNENTNNNGKQQTQHQQKIKSYPQLDGLDSTENHREVDFNNFDELAFSANTEQINKMFGA